MWFGLSRRGDTFLSSTTLHPNMLKAAVQEVLQGLKAAGLKESGRVNIGARRVQFDNFKPKISNSARVADSAVLVGNVRVSDQAVVGENSVLRGETDGVVVGFNTRVGANTVLEAIAPSRPEELPKSVKIGMNCKVGNNVVLQSCVLEDDVTIEDGAVVEEGSWVEKGAVVGPCTVIPKGKRVPAGEKWEGVPPRFVEDAGAGGH